MIIRALLQSLVQQALHQKLSEMAAGATSGEAPRERPAGERPADEPPPAAQSSPPVVEDPRCAIGFVFALEIEAGGLLDLLSNKSRTEGKGIRITQGLLAGRRVAVAIGGVGRAAATRTAEALILGHRPQIVISCGFAGGLDPALAVGDILLADEIVAVPDERIAIDLALDRSAIANLPHLHIGRLLTVDKLVRTPAEKAALGQAHAALAVDLESIAVAQTCRQLSAPLLSVRIISDAAGDELPREVGKVLAQKSTVGQIGAAVGSLFSRPSSIKDFWKLREDALVQSDKLAKFLKSLVVQWAPAAEA